MLGIESPLHYVVEQMRLLSDDTRLSEWLDRAPTSCGSALTLKHPHLNVGTHIGDCIDDVCKLRGQVRNPDADMYGIGFIMASNLDNPAIRWIEVTCSKFQNGPCFRTYHGPNLRHWRGRIPWGFGSARLSSGHGIVFSVYDS